MTKPEKTKPVCVSCGVNPATKKMEDGGKICVECDEYYADGGPGEKDI